jgi:ubiquinone/menaquinone biosynthesis C-methylase UbiE
MQIAAGLGPGPRCNHGRGMPTPPLTPLATAVLEVGEPERVLQVQCGDGEGALFLAREFPRARVRGVDRSERAIRGATGRVGLDPEGRVAFKVGRPGDLPFPDDHFDLVALLDAEPSAREVARVLRPGGFLVLAYSRRSRAPRGLRRRVLRGRLGGAGIEPVAGGPAGDGSFSVGRLRGADALPAAG